ncbi:hypothetical protein BU24DRAFT_253228 [Aaosphaeria arxii CBS 175.79]|uniref:Uncharacterized protein n=1 Tax=Aaosphaeria arxii CBS 175.79 TaxID=1450172 RepID=A0A6A5XI11_9PLEO|nr:uncharacterized protein BU24DRAFT_253228 [Aaosphaeria arxii CBS 175.79]KAF2012506.1 hypothetical protein BU24DRAFT_253228 [Aaosphaeria arxii CBS 175.79]
MVVFLGWTKSLTVWMIARGSSIVHPKEDEVRYCNSIRSIPKRTRNAEADMHNIPTQPVKSFCHPPDAPIFSSHTLHPEGPQPTTSLEARVPPNPATYGHRARALQPTRTTTRGIDRWSGNVTLGCLGKY